MLHKKSFGVTLLDRLHSGIVNAAGFLAKGPRACTAYIRAAQPPARDWSGRRGDGDGELALDAARGEVVATRRHGTHGVAVPELGQANGGLVRRGSGQPHPGCRVHQQRGRRACAVIVTYYSRGDAGRRTSKGERSQAIEI